MTTQTHSHTHTHTTPHTDNCICFPRCGSPVRPQIIARGCRRSQIINYLAISTRRTASCNLHHVHMTIVNKASIQQLLGSSTLHPETLIVSMCVCVVMTTHQELPQSFLPQLHMNTHCNTTQPNSTQLQLSWTSVCIYICS